MTTPPLLPLGGNNSSTLLLFRHDNDTTDGSPVSPLPNLGIDLQVPYASSMNQTKELSDFIPQIFKDDSQEAHSPKPSGHVFYQQPKFTQALASMSNGTFGDMQTAFHSSAECGLRLRERDLEIARLKTTFHNSAECELRFRERDLEIARLKTTFHNSAECEQRFRERGLEIAGLKKEIEGYKALTGPVKNDSEENVNISTSSRKGGRKRKMSVTKEESTLVTNEELRKTIEVLKRANKTMKEKNKILRSALEKTETKYRDLEKPLDCPGVSLAKVNDDNLQVAARKSESFETEVSSTYRQKEVTVINPFDAGESNRNRLLSGLVFLYESFASNYVSSLNAAERDKLMKDAKTIFSATFKKFEQQGIKVTEETTCSACGKS